MIIPLSASLVRQVAMTMRDADRREIFATSGWQDDALRFAARVCTAEHGAVIATLRQPMAPVAVVAVKTLWPGVYGAGLFATDRFPEVALQAIRYVTRALMPRLWDSGALRVECHSLADHVDAHRLLARLGATAEAAVPMFGRNGEDFVRYAWTRRKPGRLLEHRDVLARTDEHPQQLTAA